MTDMSIISVGAMKFTATTPFTRNKKGLLIQQPHIALRDDNRDYFINGRDVMWSFLDALFPDDPLPRNAVEDDLYAPDVDSPSMWQMLKDFAYEAWSEGNDYLIMYHNDGVVTMVQSLNAVNLSNDIEIAGQAMAAMIGAKPTYSVVKYRDKHGTHLRRIARVYEERVSYEVIDLGTRWYMRIISCYNDNPELSVCLAPPTAVKKAKKGGIAETLVSWRKEAKGFTGECPYDSIKPLPTLSSVLTREYDMLRYERYRGIA